MTHAETTIATSDRLTRLRDSSTKLAKVADLLDKDAFDAVVRSWMREKQKRSNFDLSSSENERVHDFVTQSQIFSRCYRTGTSRVMEY